MRLVTPVDVSLWTIATALMARDASSASFASSAERSAGFSVSVTSVTRTTLRPETSMICWSSRSRITRSMLRLAIFSRSACE